MICKVICAENDTINHMPIPDMNNQFYYVLGMGNIMKQTENNTASMSLSKQRKLERMQALKKQKKDAALGKIAGLIVSIVLIAAVLALFGAGISRMLTKVNANSNYSAELNEDGTIKNVNASDSVTLCDYKNIVIPYADIAYADEEIDKEIETLRQNYAELTKDTTIAAKDGDKVNIDYVGTIEGIPFDGGNTQGSGADVTIGSGSLIDDFEQQLIGHVAGDSFDVTVTFPDEYPNDPELEGQEAVFSVVMNGIYVVPEFNDKFVLKYLGDYALTADEYCTYLRETKEDSNLTTKVREYLIANSEVTNYPKSYLKQIKSLKKFEDLSYYQNINEYYASVLGGALYPTFASYVGMTEAKYDKSLTDSAKTIVKQHLITQAIAENEGIKADEATYLAYLVAQGETEENFNNDLANYGKAYLMRAHIDQQVIDFVKENVTIQK